TRARHVACAISWAFPLSACFSASSAMMRNQWQKHLREGFGLLLQFYRLRCFASTFRCICLAPPANELFQHHQNCAEADEDIGKVEHREGPSRRVEQNVTHDMAVDGPVDHIAHGAAKDQREAEA